MSSQTDTLRKLLKATEKSTAAAQKLAAEFMTKGKEQAGEFMNKSKEQAGEFVTKSKEQADHVRGLIETEVERQLARVGFATQADIAKLEARVDALTSKAAPKATTTSAPKPAAKPVAQVAAKPVAKKPAAPKPAAARKPAAKKAVK